MVALNAAAAFIAAGLSPDFAHGIKLARKTIHNGNALQKLNDLIAKSKSFEK